MILPCGTKIVAEVTNVEKPKWFNKNARVSLIFRKIVFPDNTCIDIKARPFTKDCKLKEGPWTTAGKLTLSTLTLGAAGAGAGVGFAFIPNPAKIGTGLAIGIPVGCSVGLVLGLITPGCHYKAKKGEAVYAILLDQLSIFKPDIFLLKLCAAALLRCLCPAFFAILQMVHRMEILSLFWLLYQDNDI